MGSYAKSYETNCFREHITESIAINRKRKNAYKELTNGESDRIFNTLIAAEVVSLGPATYYDFKARPYQKNNMELFCHEFVSLNHAPIFDPDNRISPKEKFRPFDWNFYQTRLNTAVTHKRIDALRKISIEALIELKQYPQYYCMTRHMIESVYRFAHFIPIRQAEARTFGLKDPTDLMLEVIKLQVLPLPVSYKLDLWSQPIQESGIPILCSEIPDLLFDIESPELEALKAQGK